MYAFIQYACPDPQDDTRNPRSTLSPWIPCNTDQSRTISQSSSKLGVFPWAGKSSQLAYPGRETEAQRKAMMCHGLTA